MINKNIFSWFLILAGILLFSSCQDSILDEKELIKQNKIEKCFIYLAKDNSGKSKKPKKILETLMIFDRNGNRTLFKTFTPDSALDNQEFVVYDKQERWKERKYFLSDSTIAMREIALYTANGKLQTVTSFNNFNEKNSIEEYKYDKGNNLKEIINMSPDKSIINFIEKNTYDANNNLLQTKRLNGDGSQQLRQQCRYDENNNRIEIRTYNENNELMNRQNFEYNSDKLITKVLTYNAAGKLEWKRLQKYNDDGRLTESADYDPNESLSFKYIMEYDDNGMLIKKSYYDSESNAPQKIYEYQYTHYK